MAKPKTTQWLVKKNAHLKAPVAFLVVFSVIMSTTAVAFAYATKLVVDAAQAGEGDRFVVAAAVVVGVLVFQIILRALNHYLAGYYRFKTDKHMKSLVFNDILHKEQAVLDARHSGQLMNHLQSDVRTVSEGLVDIVPRFVFLVLRFALAFALLFVLDSLFALVMALFGVCLLLGSFAVRNAIRKRHHAMQDAEANVRGLMQESLEHVMLIKAFEAEDYTKAHVEHAQKGFFGARLAKQRLSVFAGTALSGFFSAAYAFAIVFGAYRIGTGALTFGSLVAIIQLVEFMQSPFAGLSTLIPKYYAMTTSAERLMALEAAPHEAPKQTLPEGDFNAVIATDVGFDYGDGKVLEGLSFRARKGELIHIRGASGIGKTTLFKLLLGLRQPSEGRIDVEFDGVSVPAGPTTRRLFSYVPQGLMMQSGTIRDNIVYSTKDASEEAVVEAAIAAGIHEEIMAMEKAYDTPLKERGQGLSEGQIQRLAIARSLLRNAPVLLLDEATSALDATTEATVLEHIRRRRDKVVFIISHRPLDEEMVDHAITL